MHSVDVTITIFFCFSTAREVAETFMIIGSISTDSDQTHACVNTCMCIYLREQCCVFPFFAAVRASVLRI